MPGTDGEKVTVSTHNAPGAIVAGSTPQLFVWLKFTGLASTRVMPLMTMAPSPPFVRTIDCAELVCSTGVPENARLVSERFA